MPQTVHYTTHERLSVGATSVRVTLCACGVRHRASRGSPSAPPTTQSQTRTVTRQGTSLAGWPSPAGPTRPAPRRRDVRSTQEGRHPRAKLHALKPVPHHQNTMHSTFHTSITTHSTSPAQYRQRHYHNIIYNTVNTSPSTLSPLPSCTKHQHIPTNSIHSLVQKVTSYSET